MKPLPEFKPLLQSTIAAAPHEQFALWFADATALGRPLPEGVALATVGTDGRPSVRIVLLKGVDSSGLRFFTNYESRKARELAENPAGALCFWWPELQRQVRVEGAVCRLSEDQSDAYHATRPRGSQLGAWASDQSRAVASREALGADFAAVELRFAGATVPRPPHWGGFLLQPERWEFWQGQDNRMHDRLVYERTNDGDAWRLLRLAP